MADRVIRLADGRVVGVEERAPAEAGAAGAVVVTRP